MSRSWIDAYISYNRNFPSPLVYKTFCALACLSSAVRRKVFLGPWNKPIYPALYIALVGPQGLLYKGGNVSIAKQVVRMSGVVPLMPDAGSREALASTLKSYMDPQPKVVGDDWESVLEGAQGSLFVGELSDLLGSSMKKDDLLLNWLQTWYDCRSDDEPWEYRTQARWDNPEKLYQICVNCLFGTTPTYIHKKFPEGCTEEGMGSRVLWVVQDYEDAIKSDRRWDWPHDEAKDLAKDLQWIDALKGEIQYTDEGWDARMATMSRWEDELLSSANDPVAGFLARRHDHLVKIAILHAVSIPERREKLELRAEDVIYSSDLVDQITPDLRALWGRGSRDAATTLAIEMRKALFRSKTSLKVKSGAYHDVNGTAVFAQFKSHYTHLYGHSLSSKAIDVMFQNGWARVLFERIDVAGLGPRKVIEHVSDDKMDIGG